MPEKSLADVAILCIFRGRNGRHDLRDGAAGYARGGVRMDQREPDVASATECTGLMPALPQDESQDVNSARLYGIHPAKRRRRAKAKKK